MYARAVRALRLKELQNPECMTAVRAGLGSIIPLQLLTMLTPLEMELRTCGLPHINLEFLKVRTLLFFSAHSPSPAGPRRAAAQRHCAVHVEPAPVCRLTPCTRWA